MRYAALTLASCVSLAACAPSVHEPTATVSVESLQASAAARQLGVHTWVAERSASVASVTAQDAAAHELARFEVRSSGELDNTDGFEVLSIMPEVGWQRRDAAALVIASELTPAQGAIAEVMFADLQQTLDNLTAPEAGESWSATEVGNPPRQLGGVGRQGSTEAGNPPNKRRW